MVHQECAGLIRHFGHGVGGSGRNHTASGKNNRALSLGDHLADAIDQLGIRERSLRDGDDVVRWEMLGEMGPGLFLEIMS